MSFLFVFLNKPKLKDNVDTRNLTANFINARERKFLMAKVISAPLEKLGQDFYNSIWPEMNLRPKAKQF